jgi:hypothetical protein
MFPLDTTIPPVSPLFPLDTKNRGVPPSPGMANRPISEFTPGGFSSYTLCFAAPLFSGLSVPSVVRPLRRCLLSPLFLATRHQPLATAFLTPIIPALTVHSPVSPIIPALTRTPRVGGAFFSTHLRASGSGDVSNDYYCCTYSKNVGAPTFFLALDASAHVGSRSKALSYFMLLLATGHRSRVTNHALPPVVLRMPRCHTLYFTYERSDVAREFSPAWWAGGAVSGGSYGTA